MTEAQRRDDASREPGELSPDGEPGPQGGTSDEGIIDLLGLLAYAELDAYFRLTEDAALAPSLADKAALAGMAAAEFGHFRLLCDQLSALGVQPEQAMLPFTPALDAFHARTAPADWLEGLVKAYVGDGIAADFYRAVAELVDPQTRDLVLRVLADTGHAEFMIARVRAAIAVEESPAPPGQLGDIGRMLAHITDAHAQRMSSLGLASLSGAPAYPAPPVPPREHASVAGETHPALLDVGQFDVGDLAGRD